MLAPSSKVGRVPRTLRSACSASAAASRRLCGRDPVTQDPKEARPRKEVSILRLAIHSDVLHDPLQHPDALPMTHGPTNDTIPVGAADEGSAAPPSASRSAHGARPSDRRSREVRALRVQIGASDRAVPLRSILSISKPSCLDGMVFPQRRLRMLPSVSPGRGGKTV